jgi:hypothetical protein
MEENMWDRRSLVLCNEFKKLGKRKLRGILRNLGKMRYRMVKGGAWRSKGMRENADQGICPVCWIKEGGSHILRYEETRNWRNKCL